MITKLEDRIGLQFIAGERQQPDSLDVIFVHGLGGGSQTTWAKDGKPENFWPSWLAEEFPSFGFWTMGYGTSVSAWKERSMPLADLGNQILEDLHVGGIGGRPVVFVAHSMGGLVTKQILSHAQSQGVPRWERIASQTRGIAFLSTPHSGANLASFAEFTRIVLNTSEQLSELTQHSARLRELHGAFLSFVNKHDLVCRTFAERQEVKPSIELLGIRLKIPKGIVVVDATSAEPNIPRERAIPLDEDHISICKPVSRKAQLYRYICSFLNECIAVGPFGGADESPYRSMSTPRFVEATQHPPCITIDCRDINPQIRSAPLLQGFNPNMTVKKFLGMIYQRLKPYVAPASYGEQWFLVDTVSGVEFKNLGTSWALEESLDDGDTRLVKDIGITAGMNLKVLPIDLSGASMTQNVPEVAGIADRMEFHVFLSHNSKDKSVVKRLGAALKDRGLRVWLDEWELAPGSSWMEELESIVSTCRSSAVCVGANGIGPWEEPEMQALLIRFMEEKRMEKTVRVIPVLLPGAPAEVKLPVFLKTLTWVDLRDGLKRPLLDRLEWGITGVKPIR